MCILCMQYYVLGPCHYAYDLNYATTAPYFTLIYIYIIIHVYIHAYKHTGVSRYSRARVRKVGPQEQRDARTRFRSYTTGTTSIHTFYSYRYHTHIYYTFANIVYIYYVI